MSLQHFLQLILVCQKCFDRYAIKLVVKMAISNLHCQDFHRQFMNKDHIT